MKPRVTKSDPNMALKLAIVRSQNTQRALAQETGIPEVRLSKIVTGRETATSKEQKRLAKALHSTTADLFEAVSS